MRRPHCSGSRLTAGRRSQARRAELAIKQHPVAGADEAVYPTFANERSANQPDANRPGEGGRDAGHPELVRRHGSVRFVFRVAAPREPANSPRAGQQMETRDGNGADT
jgi:hypothetical protein